MFAGRRWGPNQVPIIHPCLLQMHHALRGEKTMQQWSPTTSKKVEPLMRSWRWGGIKDIIWPLTSVWRAFCYSFRRWTFLRRIFGEEVHTKNDREVPTLRSH
jgi:hypothetical protein